MIGKVVRVRLEWVGIVEGLLALGVGEERKGAGWAGCVFVRGAGGGSGVVSRVAAAA